MSKLGPFHMFTTKVSSTRKDQPNGHANSNMLRLWADPDGFRLDSKWMRIWDYLKSNDTNTKHKCDRDAMIKFREILGTHSFPHSNSHFVYVLILNWIPTFSKYT